MDRHDSFAELTGRLRAGDQDAAAEIFRVFAGRLIALARTELGRRVRQKVDPEDVVQSVYRSFFTRFDAGRFDLATWDELWGLLTTITLRKCVDRARYYQARRRDTRAEVALRPRDDAPEHPSWVVDREPTPMEAAILAETVEQLMRGLDPDDRAMVELTLQGYTAAEIGDRLGFSERTVRRVRDRMRGRLLRMHEEGG